MPRFIFGTQQSAAGTLLHQEASKAAKRELDRTQLYVPLGHKSDHKNARFAPSAHPTGTLPLCSFGPGGAYVVDWQVKTGDLADPRRQFPPRTLASILRRVVGYMLWDAKGWLIASHPNRTYRADSHPATLDPCQACGHTDRWPTWFVEGESTPPLLIAVDKKIPTPLAPESQKNENTLSNPDNADPPANYPFPANFHGNEELEPVAEFHQSPAGRLIAQLTADARDCGTMRLFAEDDLVPDGSSNSLGGAHSPEPAQLTESSHDTHSQTTQNPGGHPRLPGPSRLLANDAGTRRSARRLKSHHLRARRGPGKESAHSACPQQGSLFGSLADGEAA